MSLAGRLYRGETDYDVVGRRRTWFLISGVLLLLSFGGLFIRQLNLGIDFTGGAVFEVTTAESSLDRARTAVEDAGVEPKVVQRVGDRTRIQTEELLPADVNKVLDALQDEFQVADDSITASTVGAKWGQQVTSRAVRGLVVFLVLVVAFISLRFEPKMAAGAIVALVHDLVITIGIYALVGFEVTPSTVIASLTILGYSLYDTVVVYDKVRENTVGLAGGSRMTYSQAANLAINQTIMRSLNTSLFSLLPVASLLFFGAGVLGAGTLKDLSLALFIGIATGAYSSIFIAAPIVALLKEREPQFKALAARVQGRVGRTAATGRLATATATAGGSGGSVEVSSDDPAERTTAPVRKAGPPRPPRPQKRKGKGGRGGRPSGKKRR